MALSTSRRRSTLPLPLQRRSNDEYFPLAYSERDRRAMVAVESRAQDVARRHRMSLSRYAESRMGTAAALRAIDEAWGGGFYAVTPEAETDPAAADAALGGGELVIDVQTHYIADRRAQTEGAAGVLAFIQTVAPDRWKGLNGAAGLTLAEYVRCVFLESETAVAVLTSAPGDEPRSILTNTEIAGTRELVDRLAGTGRLLNHSIVHPNRPGELDAMSRLAERFKPAGWKVYTLYGDQTTGGRGWMLDDEAIGLPFLQRVQDSGVRTVCAHKGLSALTDTGSPIDVGPAAAAFPGIDFLVYHSGYETPLARGGDDQEEGPYSDEESGVGTNRLVKSLRDAGIGPGANVYAELGSTWYLLMRRPREAAHVLGKLLLAVGEENVLWGSDSIWYGSPQPLIDAFRAFQIPPEYTEKYGYPQLTQEVKEKVLGLNAARVYGIDVEQARRAARDDDLAWTRAALAEYESKGVPASVG